MRIPPSINHPHPSTQYIQDIPERHTSYIKKVQFKDYDIAVYRESGRGGGGRG